MPRNWKSEATNHINKAVILLKKDAAVMVEGKSDVEFWEVIFRKFAPELKLKFNYYSEKGGGRNEVVNYKKYAEQRLLLCVDSDYNYLLQDEEILNNLYIFQTYTHSIENYNCIPENLNKMLEAVRGDVDFKYLLSEYSKTIYRQLLWTLHVKGIGMVKPNKKVLYLKTTEINLNDFSNTLNEVKSRVDTFIKEKEPDKEVLENLNRQIKKLGIKKTETYLYIQGHSIQDCVVKNLINKLFLSNKEKSTSLKYTWKESLKNNYLLALENPETTPMHKIKADIEKYLTESLN